MQIHVNRDGQQFGPYSVEQIKELLGQGSLLTTDWVWYDGLPEWVQILQIEDFSADSAQPAAVEPVQSSEVQPMEAATDTPAEPAQVSQPTAPAKGGVSAAAVAERLRRLNKGKPAASSAARLAKQPVPTEQADGGAGSKFFTKARIMQAVVIVLLLAVIAAVVFFNLPKAQHKLSNKPVAKSTTVDTAKKILGLEGGHLTRDANNEISGIMFPSISISSNGWKSLGELKNLQVLSVAGCDVNDSSLANLKGLVSLTLLDVSENPITDKSVDVLKGLIALTELNLTGTKITVAGVANIKKALPDCAVKREGAAPPGKGDPKGKPK